MARLVWVAVGAAGGIYAYKRATAAFEDARERASWATSTPPPPPPRRSSAASASSSRCRSGGTAVGRESATSQRVRVGHALRALLHTMPWFITNGHTPTSMPWSRSIFGADPSAARTDRQRPLPWLTNGTSAGHPPIEGTQ